jgi:hypothetical protein
MVARVKLPDPPVFVIRGDELPEHTGQRWGEEMNRYVQGVHRVLETMTKETTVADDPIMSELLQLRGENESLRVQLMAAMDALADCQAGTSGLPDGDDGRDPGTDGPAGGEPAAC